METRYSPHQGIIDMSWDGDAERRECSSSGVEFANKALDVAVLRLAPVADGPGLTRPLTQLSLPTKPVITGERALVMHHPACVPKSVTRGCSVMKAGFATWTEPVGGGTATESTHNCTTGNASSDGPVYSTYARLVGLHHLGVIARELKAAEQEPRRIVWPISYRATKAKRVLPHLTACSTSSKNAAPA